MTLVEGGKCKSAVLGFLERFRAQEFEAAGNRRPEVRIVQPDPFLRVLQQMPQFLVADAEVVLPFASGLQFLCDDGLGLGVEVGALDFALGAGDVRVGMPPASVSVKRPSMTCERLPSSFLIVSVLRTIA